MHPLVKEKPGRKPFREIKTMKEDPAGVERMSEEIKTRYSQDVRRVIAFGGSRTRRAIG